MSDKPRPMPVAAASTDRSPYHGYRFPPEIIAHAVWLYFRFHLSFPDFMDLLAERGVIVSHKTIRQLGHQVRCRLCRPATSATSTTWRQVAPRRGHAEDLPETPLAKAGGRSERSCAGYPGPTAAGSAR